MDAKSSDFQSPRFTSLLKRDHPLVTVPCRWPDPLQRMKGKKNSATEIMRENMRIFVYLKTKCYIL